MVLSRRRRARRIDRVDGKDVYAYGCGGGTIRQEGRFLARRIDYVETLDIMGQPSGDFLPVYAIAAECCERDDNLDLPLVEDACWPPDGLEQRLTARFSIVNNPQHCHRPQCSTFQLIYDSGTQKWLGSLALTGGTLNFALECQPLAVPGQRWKMVITGCTSVNLTLYGFGDAGPPFSISWGSQSLGDDTCCACSGSTPLFDLAIKGKCDHFKLARRIDRVDGKDVYAYAECCEESGYAAADCCERLPCTLYAELATDDPDCACMNGLIIPLTFNPLTGGWGGSGGSCGASAVHVAFFCLTGDVPGYGCTENRCPEDSFSDCADPTYDGGQLSASIQCGSSLATIGTGYLCNQCGCLGIDVTITVVVTNGNDGCTCGSGFLDTSTVTVRITE